MKKISLLVLVSMIFLLCLTSCGLFSTEDEHEHTFSSEWSTSETEHWHAASCEHADQKSDVASHSDAGEDGVCDVCNYVIYNLYTVSVTADELVTLSSTAVTVKEGTDATFTATVSDKYVLTATGAEVVGEPTVENGNKVYTFKVSAVSADTSVTVSAEKKVFASVAAEGTGKFESLEAFNYASSSITFNALTAGTYTIMGTEGLVFGLEGSDDAMWVYEFTVEEAGEVNLVAKYFSWSAMDEFAYEYSIVSVDEVVLPAGEGEGYVIPAFETTVKIVAPTTPGLYWVGSDLENMVWNGVWGTGCFVNVKEGDEYIELTVKINEAEDAVYELDYSVVIPADVIIVSGDNTIDVLLGNYTKVTFTATEAGSYVIACTQNYSTLYTWDDEYEYMGYHGSSVVTKALAAGEAVTYYINNSYAETDIDEVVNVTYAGFVLDTGANTVSANGTGVAASVINSGNWEDRTYLITAGENAKLGFIGENGEIVYVDSKEVFVLDGASVSFVVATVDGTDADVTVSVELVVYEVYLEIGDNTLELVPGAEYTVYAYDLSYYTEYALTFNSDLVYISSWGSGIESGVTNQWYGSLTLTLVGDSAATVTVTLSSKSSASVELKSGDNTITVEDAWNGTEVAITAPYSGTYTITPGTNAVVIYDYTCYYAGDTLELTLITDETVTLVVVTEDYEPGDVVVSLDIEFGAIDNELALGDSTITVVNSWNGTEVVIVADATGVYTVTPGTNAVVGYDYTNYYAGEALTLVLTEGDVVSILIFTEDWEPGDVSVNLSYSAN